MAHSVRDVPFTEKSRARRWIPRELRVQHLDGSGMPVTMGRAIPRGHPTRADSSVDLPLAVDDRTDAPLRPAACAGFAHPILLCLSAPWEKHTKRITPCKIETVGHD